MLATMMFIPTTKFLPVSIVRLLLPVPMATDVVEVALVEGAIAAEAAETAAADALEDAAAALVTAVIAALIMLVKAGTSRDRKPPLAKPVVGLLVSSTVELSPPTELGNVTDAIICSFGRIARLHGLCIKVTLL